MTLLLLAAVLVSGCVARLAPPGPIVETPTETEDLFIMPDGTALPYRVWLPPDSPPITFHPDASQRAPFQGAPFQRAAAHPAGHPAGTPSAIVLAVHGMNDSRDAWEYPAPDLAAAGIAVFAPDLRGFGATASRGLWPGTDGLTSDVRTMVGLLRARYPRTKFFLMGESMGAAALMVLATQPDPPPVDGYVLIAPAVWGRSKMNLLMRTTLWLADHTWPGLKLTGGGLVKVTASDNRQALIRLSTDRLTIHATRVDAIKGLVDLMDQAEASAPHFHAPALVLYGGHDELVPARATAATWRALPPGPVRAFYPGGYHLLLRDKDRAAPIADILAWMRDPDAPLPSGAQTAARLWLAEQDDKD